MYNSGIKRQKKTRTKGKYPGYPTCMSYEATNMFGVFGNNPFYWQYQSFIDSQVAANPGVGSVEFIHLFIYFSCVQ